MLKMNLIANFKKQNYLPKLTEEPVKSCKIILHLLQFLFHKTQQKAYEDEKLQKSLS